MADENTPQGTPGQGQQPPQNTPQGTQQQEPAWLQHIPEQYREEAKKNVLLQSDYTRKTTEIAEKQKAWEQEKQQLAERLNNYDTWYRDQYAPFYQKAQPHMEKIIAMINGQQAQAQQPAQSNGNDPFEHYDVLPPQEQAKRLAEYLNQNYLSNALSALKQEFNQTLAQREAYYSNLLNVMTDAYGRKFQNPGLDLQAYMKEALEIQSGKKNPLDLAYTSVTKEADLKNLQEQFYKKGREDMELEFKNKQLSSGALQSETIPLFKQKPLTREQVEESVRQKALKAGLPW